MQERVFRKDLIILSHSLVILVDLKLCQNLLSYSVVIKEIFMLKIMSFQIR